MIIILIFFQKAIDKSMIFRYNIDMRVLQAATRTSHTEMYSRGRRGAPAKGVGRLSRRESSNLSISAIQVHNSNVVDLFFLSSGT